MLKRFDKISSLILFPSFFFCPCLPPTFLSSLLPCFHSTSLSPPTPSLSYFLPARCLLWLPLILSFPPSWPNSSLPSSLHLLLRFSFRLFFPIFLFSYLSSSHPPSPLSFLYSIVSSFLLNVLPFLPPFPFFIFLFLASLTCN